MITDSKRADGGRADVKRADGEGADVAKGPNPVKVKKYTDGLRDVYEKGQEIEADGHAKLFVLGLVSLINAGELDAAAYVAPRLLKKFPDIDYLKTIVPVIETLPPAVDDAKFASFTDDTEAAVQTVHREGASTLLLGFGGLSGKMMIPLTLMHRLIGPSKIHVAYIRMEAWSPIHNGPTLGRSSDAVFEAISKIVDEFSPKTVVCQGHSGGALGGLLTSMKLNIERVLCFSTPIDTARSKSVARFAKQAGLPATWSFRDEYEKAKRKPSVRLVYGSDFEIDRQQAELMKGVPGVELEPVPGLAEHESFTPTLISGRYDALLRELVDGVPAGSASNAK